MSQFPTAPTVVLSPTGTNTGPWNIAKASFITPELFGAVGDGTTDDYNAMQDAINAATSAGVPLYLSAKTYKVSQGLLATGAPLKLIGTAQRSVIAGGYELIGPVLSVVATPRNLQTAASIGGASASVTNATNKDALSLTHCVQLKAALNGCSDFTFEMVVKSSDSYSALWFNIRDQGITTGALPANRVLVQNEGGYKMYLNLTQMDGSVVDYSLAGGSAGTGSTDYVAFVRSGTTLTCYVNGEEAGSLTGATGTLKVAPLDDVVLLGQQVNGLLTTDSTTTHPIYADSMAFATSSSAYSTPSEPYTVPWIGTGGYTGFWFSAGDFTLQPDGSPVASGWAKVWDSTVGWRGAFMQYNSLTFNTNFSEIRNLTISGGDVALLMAGAPQSIIENVQTSGYQPIGIWLADNCYHAVVRDCYLQTQKFSAFISSGHSGDLLVENVHAAFQTGFGFIGWLLQDTVKFLRCYVDGTMLGGFIFGGNDVNSTVSLDSVTVGSESGVSPSYYVAVAFSSQGTLSIRDSNFSQYVPLPCVVVANPPENALNFAEIAASSFSPYGGSPCVISHVGNAPLKPTMISGYKYNATGIPWAVSGDMSNVYLLSVVG